VNARTADVTVPEGSRRIPAEALEAFVTRAFVAAGMRDADSRKVAQLMTLADLRGADGHGIFRLPQYVRRIRAGGINLRPEIAVVHERPAAALVDGDNGMGHLVMRFATELAIAKAGSAGVGWIGVRGSNHAGPAALYAMMPLEQDMIGLYLAVGNANHMAPWGGIENLLSTNPIAVAIPALEEPPVVLDMATSVVAYGRVKVAAQRGEQMPEGWMIDHRGRPLTDPARAEDGVLLPIGGYKGYGLSLVFGLLAGMLNGAACGRSTVDFNKDDVTPTNTGHVIVALKIDAFSPPGTFKASVDAYIRDLRASRRMDGVERIRIPGEHSHATFVDRRTHGIPVARPLADALGRLAAELGIEAF
jgi:LDH2 family malate/lactate/ureidoglycolate dehydrogenase